MSRPSDALRLLLAACALGATCHAVAFTIKAPPLEMPAAMPAAEEVSLEDLRDEATLDPQARNALAHRLLDRFEAGGDPADLHEALRWIARDWPQQALLREGPVNRVLVGHCTRPALRRTWMCDGGE